jgi:deferrochelatase/peroxidase EfeB
MAIVQPPPESTLHRTSEATAVREPLKAADRNALDFDDIQHFLIHRALALAARYEFLTFRDPAAGRAWVKGITEKVSSAGEVRSGEAGTRWVTVAFTWNGLRALGLDDASLATFPEEFREGMAARAEILGTTGANHPDHWQGGLASADLHAIAILFARDVPERERCRVEHEQFVSQCKGVEILSSLDLEAIQPFTYAKEHFGYRDRLSAPVIEGTGEEPIPGSGPPIKAGEFFLGYPDEEGGLPALPKPEILSRNGSYLAYFKMEEHVGAFRDFLQQHGRHLKSRN